MSRHSDGYTFMFATGVCVICALVLSLAATALKPRQVQNAKLDVLQNMMSAVGLDLAELKKMDAEQVLQLYNDEFEVLLLDKDDQAADRDFMEAELIALGFPEPKIKELDTGMLLNRFNGSKAILAARADKKLKDYDPDYKIVYIHKKDGKPDAYVVPIVGYGLWDIIKGYIALETDLNTVKGVSFYEHKETPGLGARVTESWFKDNFKGKKILNGQGSLQSITVVKGKADGGPHQVDGISGATLTGDGINQFLKADLQRYEPYFQKLRQQGV